MARQAPNFKREHGATGDGPKLGDGGCATRPHRVSPSATVPQVAEKRKLKVFQCALLHILRERVYRILRLKRLGDPHENYCSQQVGALQRQLETKPVGFAQAMHALRAFFIS